MVQITGKYTSYKEENFENFLVAFGVPQERAKAAVNENPHLEVQLDGKNLVLIFSGTSSSITKNLILNEEVEEAVGSVTFKTTAVLNGDVLTLTSVRDDKEISRVFKFTENECISEHTLSGPAIPKVSTKAFYSRV